LKTFFQQNQATFQSKKAKQIKQIYYCKQIIFVEVFINCSMFFYMRL